MFSTTVYMKRMATSTCMGEGGPLIARFNACVNTVRRNVYFVQPSVFIEWRGTGTSGLETLLKTMSRPKVSEATINKCLPADRIVVENILAVVQDVIAFADISTTVISPKNNKYEVSVPLCQHYTVSLEDMRCIEAYSPARIGMICVDSASKDINLRLSIVDEQSVMSITEVDVIRISKKRRLF